MPAPHEALTDHIAVTNHGKGVGSDGLANFVACWADFAGARIRGTGHLQYDNDGLQRFEELEGTQLCDELLDELLDVVNYTAMVAIKVLAVRKELSG